MKIKSLKRSQYKGFVYNLELQTKEDKDDLFWIEQGSMIINHNCFPKDINALIFYAKELGVDIDIMEKCWEINKRIRSDIDWSTIPGAVVEDDE